MYLCYTYPAQHTIPTDTQFSDVDDPDDLDSDLSDVWKNGKSKVSVAGLGSPFPRHVIGTPSARTELGTGGVTLRLVVFRVVASSDVRCVLVNSEVDGVDFDSRTGRCAARDNPAPCRY